jgi:hypothetical protein
MISGALPLSLEAFLLFYLISSLRVIIPNLIGLLLSVITLLLFAVYPSHHIIRESASGI